MKKKYIIIFSIIVFIVIVRYGIYPLFANGSGPSNQYQSIEDLEKNLDITIYNLYDIEEFIVNDNIVSIKDTSKKLAVWGHRNSNQVDYDYSITLKNKLKNSGEYNVHIGREYKLGQSEGRQDQMNNGTLYQFHFVASNESIEVYYATLDAGDYYIEAVFYNVYPQLDSEIIENKMIDLFQYIEEMNEQGIKDVPVFISLWLNLLTNVK